jgi:hypothetical protein
MNGYTLKGGTALKLGTSCVAFEANCLNLDPNND